MKQLFDRLWADYTRQNPATQKIYDLFTAEGEQVVNDHVAFRTFNDPRVNIEVLAQPFLSVGFRECEDYHFPEKKLYAKHYEHPGLPEAPRVFISELLTEQFSASLQKTIKEILDKTDPAIFNSPELIFSACPWEPVSYEVYKALREESEYAGWLYVYGFRANHFTVSVNHLKKYDSLAKVNQFLKDHGFLLNDAGGEIKGSASELLEQSSIKSEIIIHTFTEGKYEIPACYYEFARRYPDQHGKFYSGFIARSADKIFESTHFYENKK